MWVTPLGAAFLEVHSASRDQRTASLVERCFIHTLMATDLDGVAQCRFGVQCGRMDTHRRTTLSDVVVSSMAERPVTIDATVQL